MNKIYFEIKKLRENKYILYFANIKNHTGNILAVLFRKILYKYIKGCAPVYFGINSIKHEYISVPGLSEDYMEIICNIKLIKFILINCTKILINVRKRNLGTLYADDLIIPYFCNIKNNNNIGRINILNINHVQCLKLSLVVTKGIGVFINPLNLNKIFRIKSISKLIKLNGNFSPLISVSYYVKSIFNAEVIYMFINSMLPLSKKIIINVIKNNINKYLNFYSSYIGFFNKFLCNCYVNSILSIKINLFIINKLILYHFFNKGIFFIKDIIRIYNSKIFLIYVLPSKVVRLIKYYLIGLNLLYLDK